jgi:hypothetical protein
MSIDVSGIKQGQKMMWATGDYPDLAQSIEEVAERIRARALGDDQMKAIGALDADRRTAPDPDTFVRP